MSESDSFEQEATNGISEQTDALKGFLEDKGLSGGNPSSTQADGHVADGDAPASSDRAQEASFDSAVSDVEGRWTSHGGEAPEHEPVVVEDASHPGSQDTAPTWEPLTAPDREGLDAGGGVSDGSESGQDAGSMS